jgi:hypothetical protein
MFRKISISISTYLCFTLSQASIAQFASQGLIDSLKKVVIPTNANGWSITGTTNFTFSQVGLSNWTAGGKNSVSIISLGIYKANYADNIISWNNYLELGYGLTKIGNDQFRKSDDRIIFVSQAGIAAGKTMNYSLLIDFRTQFSEGKNYSSGIDTLTGDYPITSRFLSPGYLTTGIGIELKPERYMSILLSPITGRLTFIADKDISEKGLFNVKKGEYIRANAGSLLHANFNNEVFDNVIIASRLNIFSPFDSPWRMIVNCENMITLKVNSFIKVTLSADAFYDDRIIIQRDDGTKGPATQLKNTFGVGFGYTF